MEMEQTNGALAHMDYGEVQKHASLYSFQEFLIQQQRRKRCLWLGGHAHAPRTRPQYRPSIAKSASGAMMIGA